MHHIAANKIKRAIKATGKTQGEVAKEIGISTRCLNQLLLHADNYPSKATQDKIAAAFKGLKFTRDDMLGPLPNG